MFTSWAMPAAILLSAIILFACRSMSDLAAFSRSVSRMRLIRPLVNRAAPAAMIARPSAVNSAIQYLPLTSGDRISSGLSLSTSTHLVCCTGVAAMKAS